jgi:hypothetical protein
VRQARTDQSPFQYWTAEDDSLAGRTRLEYPLLHDWLMDCGAAHVPDRAAKAAGWQAWWARTIPKLSPLQQMKAWEAFDRVPLYDVVEVPWEDGM